jgi:hypothetical protein
MQTKNIKGLNAFFYIIGIYIYMHINILWKKKNDLWGNLPFILIVKNNIIEKKNKKGEKSIY